MGRFSGGRVEDINGVPVRMGGDGGRGNGDVAIHGGGAQWSSLGKTGGGWREQRGRLHQDQAGAAEGGHEAQAADVGIEEAPRQGGTACDRAQGREAGEGMLGKVMGEIRRSFSVAIVRSQALCLLDRLSHLGPGARAAAQRRQ